MIKTLTSSLAILLLLATVGNAAVIRLSGAPPAYRLEAAGLAQVAAVDLTLGYDSAALIVEGFDNGPLVQGAMVAANLGLGGTVRIGIITTTTLGASGLLGTLRVRALTPDLPRLALQATLRDADGKLLPVTTELPYAAPKPPTTSTPAVTGTTTTTVILGGGAPFLPRVTAGSAAPEQPADRVPPPRPAADEPPAGAPRARTATAPPGKAPAAKAAEGAKETLATGSPRARFAKGLADCRSLAELAQLLALPSDVRQSPFPALSDGTTPITVAVTDSRQEQPAIAVQNARLLWSGTGSAQHIEIDLLPQADAATVEIVVVDQKQRVIELAVAPPLTLDPRRTTDDYLARWQDLDGDGQVTIDEAYRLAVNLLVQRPLPQPPPGGESLGGGEKGL